ncbi:META domain-containing protein [Streptomyces sp. NPDC002033]|uniref:META domain-containing protein n=1 Tax=unclassified Streptomyces TaxID=2593676 RepID=UPI003323D6EE
MRTLRHLAPGLAALLAALALTGCRGGSSDAVLTPDGPGSQRPAANAPLTATTWTVASVDGAAAPAGPPGPARLTIAPDGTASGSLGCNRFSAPVTVAGATLTVGPPTTTRMACEGPAGAQERALTALFAAGPLTWKIQERTLTLTAPDGKGLTAEAASAAE